MHTRSFSSRVKGQRGVALIITLAFVVLLTILIVAYFSRAVSERQVSSGSAAQTKVEIFAQGAADTVIGDLQQEILAGSVAVALPSPAPSPQSGIIYKPTVPLTMVPCRIGAAATTNINALNLIKQSLAVTGSSLPFYQNPQNTALTGGTTPYDVTDYPPPQRTSLLPTDTSVSLNGRSISIARWNAPLLLAVSSTTDYTPVAASGTAINALTAPDWILVCRSGSNPVISSSNQALDGSLQWSAANSTTVVGRYAYNIYDEGGLLDANVAGYPVSNPTLTSTSQYALYKPALAYADLTQIGLTPQQINALVGWRNNASSRVTGTFPSYAGFTTNTNTAPSYFSYVVSNQNGFIGASGTTLNNNGASATSGGQSDRAFASRQQLIQFLLDDPPQSTSSNTLLTTVNSLQYLSTFTRDFNQPSYLRLQSTNSTKALDYNASVPKVLTTGTVGTLSKPSGGNNYGGANQDDQVNPSFLGVRVIQPFTRNDGSQAVIGEPLVKRRFPLNRLAWVTYEGPSADVITQFGVNDANIQALVADGIPLSYLQQGTDLNVQKYFGLTWKKDIADNSSEWYYNVNNNDPSGQTTAAAATTGSNANSYGPILQLPTIAGLKSNAHDPDFFELLKGTINVGSIGKSLVPEPTFMGPDGSDPGAPVFPIKNTLEPDNYNYYLETDVDAQVMQIGANIITQFQPANYPIRINLFDGSSQPIMGNGQHLGHTFAGAVNLPYLYQILAGNLQVDPPNPLPYSGRDTYTGSQTSAGPGQAGYPVQPTTGSTLISSGIAACLQVPVVWNPVDPSCPATTATNGTVNGAINGTFGATPTKIRVVADTCAPDYTGDYLSSTPSQTDPLFWGFFAFGASDSTTAQSYGQYSNNGDPSSPGDTNPLFQGSAGNSKWFLDASGDTTGAAIAHFLWTPPGQTTSSGQVAEIDMTLSSGSNTWCPEPTMLVRSQPVNSSGIVQKGKSFIDLNGNQFKVSVPNNSLLYKDPATSSYMNGGVTMGGLPCATTNALDMESTDPQDAANAGIYVGFYLGSFPYAWYCPVNYVNTSHVSNASGKPVGLSAEQSSGYVTRYSQGTSDTPPGVDTAGYMTYRMQYQDPKGNWITYDMKYGKVANDQIQNALGAKLTVGTLQRSTLLCGFVGTGGDEGFWATATDPRSSRFGLFWSSTMNSNASLDGKTDNTALPPPGPEIENLTNWTGGTGGGEDLFAQGWLDPANGILYSGRPDAQVGYYFCTQPNNTNGMDAGWPFGNQGNPYQKSPGDETSNDGTTFGWMAYLYSGANGGSTFYPGLAPGLLSQNNADIPFEAARFYGTEVGVSGATSTPDYFADPDGIVRRAMGAFVPAGTINSAVSKAADQTVTEPSAAATTVGLPMARVFKWNTANLPSAAPTSPDPTINPLADVLTTSKVLLTATNQAQSRPYFLHRPFHSVAELGYVFSDTPWRNLDFFTAESGYSPLLDVFCVNDESNDSTGLVAGKVNLNTRQAPVLQAVLTEAYMDPAQPGLTLGTSGTQLGLNSPVSATVAAALVARTSDITNMVNGTGPLENLSDLVGKWIGNNKINQVAISNPVSAPSTFPQLNPPTSLQPPFYDGKLSYAGFSGGVWNNGSSPTSTMGRGPAVNSVENVKTGVSSTTGTAEDVYSAFVNSAQFASNATVLNGPLQTASYVERFREAPIRALTSVGQTRVWNLLIDVIAQTGRYPRSATSPSNFLVEGEQRYWVHVAIDRFTGQVLDKQVEVVKD